MAGRLASAGYGPNGSIKALKQDILERSLVVLFPASINNLL